MRKASAGFIRGSDIEVKANREFLRKDKELQWELAQIEASGPNWREAMAAGGAEGGEGMEAGGGAPPAGGGSGLPPDFGPPPEGGGPEVTGAEVPPEGAAPAGEPAPVQ